MTLDARRDRTALRLKLYENGFSPLANKSKLCLLKEWSTLDVTPDLIQSRQWARSGAFQDTGLRCGEIIALDWDIDDPVLLNGLLDEVVAKGLVEESPFIRIGKPPRELWVYRTSDKIGKRTTGHFTPAGAPDDSSGYAVEILGKGCQFAAYGQRDETTAYAWPEQSLLDHNYMDLPVINLKQVEALKDYAAAYFERNGLERRSPGGGTDTGYTHVYDLEPDTVFEIKDMGPMTVAELTEALRVNPDEVLRAKADTFRPTSGSWACMVSLSGGALCVSDHGTYTSHFPTDADDRKSIAELGRLLAERFPEPAEPEPEDLEIHPSHPFDDNLRKALRRFVMVESDAVVYDTLDGGAIPIGQFHENYMNHIEVDVGPRGGEDVAYMSRMWQRDPRRLTAKTMAMRPDRPYPTFTERNRLFVNTYHEPEFIAGGSPDLGLDFLAQLLPHENERAWFSQWLAFKLRNPWVAGTAVIMVARDTYGAGRGTLIDLISRMFGNNYVKSIDFATLTGRGNQSQYNEWMVDSLIVAVNEAQDLETGGSRWQARSSAYEHLKSVVDPGQRSVYIKRKGVKNSDALSYASFLIATNHGDALVIPPGDRRFGILENGAPPTPEYWAKLRAWMDVPANICAFSIAIKATDISTYNPYAAPPMTAAKADMIDAGASDLDRAAVLALTGLPGALLVRDQFVLLVENVMAENGFEFPDDWHRAAEKLFTRKTNKILGQDRLMIDGKIRTVRMLGRCDPSILTSTEKMCEEVLRNGPLTRQLKSSGKVVNFPHR